MMNRKECEKALYFLKDLEINWNIKSGIPKSETICSNLLAKLIEEHFDNPPFKFEELKEGMWVWDNKKKCYLQCNPAISTEMSECVWYESFWYNDGKDYDEFYEDYLEFEENRFYRKQVQE